MRRKPSRHRSFLLLLILLCAGIASDSAAQQPTPYDSLNVDGTWLFYRERGEGEPLLLLHGFSSSGRSWDRTPLVDHFAKHYRVIMPDLRGRGRSVDPDGDLSPGRSATDVFELLDHLHITETRALGLSFGSLVLLHMATAQPERLNALVLISGGPYIPQRARLGIARDADPSSIPDEQLSVMAQRNGHVGGAPQVRQILGAFYDARGNYTALNFTPPYLSTITAPTLIVHGDRDLLFPVDLAMEMYTAIPNAYLWVLPAQGHESMFESGVWLGRLAETTSEFLDGQWQAR